MSLLQTLGDIGVYAGQHVALPVVAAWLTAKNVTAGAVGGKVERADRLAGYLSEDLRRWMADRDRAADVRMSEVTEQARVQGVDGGGVLTQAAGRVYRQVLHDYRDEATRKLRELDDLLAGEGRLHCWHRRRKGKPAPTLELTSEGGAILTKWRQAAEEDPSRAEIEPRLGEIEAA